MVEDVADLWAMERSGVFKGRYHVLGGSLSALDGIGPVYDGVAVVALDHPRVREAINALAARGLVERILEVARPRKLSAKGQGAAGWQGKARQV